MWNILFIMAKEYKKACFGGTFDAPLHKGHKALIRKAFRIAEFCYIGLTSDEYVIMHGKEGVNSFGERKSRLVKFLDSEKIPKSCYKITKLDRFFSDDVLDKKAGIEAIIVSRATAAKARGINILREDYKLKPMKIIEIDTVMAKDKKRISSGRIRAREIDEKGKILKC